MSSAGVNMWTLVVNLSVFAGRPVIDRTGFEDPFDYDLTWMPEIVPPGLNAADTGSPDAPSLFNAIREQLGLKLESARGPVEVLVIDHVELPTQD